MEIQNLRVIAISQIEISNTNPRKYFDEKALNELSASIKEHGIFQPILVRPINEQNDRFELVCGERRFRAAKLAELIDIPVNIRVLTDDEAFELQIVENLERKDVHPLDEADAFKKMLDSEKYTITDISGKMAKSESFIAQRLKLVDLIEEIRNDFLKDNLGIGHAILIARCDEEQQKEIFNEAQPYSKGTADYGTIWDLTQKIENKTFDLSKATFDKESETLIPECGSCTVCPKRSGYNPILFEDMQDVDRCFDKTCFNEKGKVYFENEVTRIITEAEDFVLITGYNSPSAFVIDICKKYNVKLLECHKDYSSKESDNLILKKAFGVSGNVLSTYLDVWVKEEVLVDIAIDGGVIEPISKEVIEAKEDIQKIKIRQKRALELDEEKIWGEIRSIDCSSIHEDEKELNNKDKIALAIALLGKLSWGQREKISKEINITIENINEIEISDNVINKLIRIFYLDSLNESYGSCKTNLNAAGFRLAVEPYFPSEVKMIDDNQKEQAEKRISKANIKLKDLEAKIEKEKKVSKKPIETKKKKKALSVI